jgi:DNA-binding CsgD family transcriptional regulator
MQSKVKQSTETSQDLPAGVLPTDQNIEFVGVSGSKTVLWMQHGHTKTWKALPKPIYKKLKALFFTDHEAVKFLSNNYKAEAHNLNRLVELYTYYMYGDLDHTPDVIDGTLQPSENFRESKNCPSLQFSNKFININGAHLSQRDLKILDDIIEGLPDKAIAHKLGICIGTFDFHKKNLFKKLGVDNKVSLAVISLKHHITCEH